MSQESRLLLPESPTLVVSLAAATWLSVDGEIEEITLKEAAQRTGDERPLLCHAPAVARRLDIARFPCFDVLELFAFVRPATFCVPTIPGLADALQLTAPGDATEQGTTLRTAAMALLRELALQPRARDDLPVAWAMARGGWSWGVSVLAALGEEAGERERAPAAGLDVWRNLPEWQEHAPPPPPGNLSVDPAESRARLAELLGEDAESRPSQSDYASAVSAVFTPRIEEDMPNLVLAEAGTGVGKTLGYIAPASVWSERNEAPVWISTYTRNLQHQIDQELDRLYPDREKKRNRVVVRKGRENYLCLLNYEEAVRGVAVRRGDAVPLGLTARWAARTRDGDTTGGDFPSWLSDILGAGATTGLTDRRGECIYSACAHYTKCYIERGIRRARRANLVVANHALVMIHAAHGMPEQGGRPTRFVFDEGHHVFDAADSAFSAHLTGMEGAELRRWLRGAEGRRRSRSRGLKTRAGDLIGNDTEAEQALEAVIAAAAILPSEGWRQRSADGQPQGPAETFLTAVRGTVYARVDNVESPFNLDVSVEEPTAELLSAAARLHEALGRLSYPLRQLRERLMARLDTEADNLDSTTRNRIEAIARSLKHRGEDMVEAWRFMLSNLPEGTPPEHVDWYSVERIDGRDIDVGMHRHWTDPTLPFSEVVLNQAQGVLVTSATLTDGSGDVDTDWRAAETRTGASHLPAPAIRSAVPSPFDYATQTRVFVATDLRKNDLEQVAAAYRVLFLAAGGGGLGLFTAIGRLRAAHRRLLEPLDQANIPLYAQHVDALNLATLVDIFRAEEDSCLLGTDAVRDGVDVPGRALRLIVFDRVPWPRPTILHRARRKAFGARAYDDMITRLRLKQAYGRLIRRGGDRGVFVLLDSMMPSRLAGAFPEGVEIERVGLAEATAETQRFLTRET
ncbi:MAG: ATP-dependent DNA helicase [Alphaproteobacteria bacterium]|nr:ATP-dependent DNA helicase [Alphaproteobacteria bacterium]